MLKIKSDINLDEVLPKYGFVKQCDEETDEDWLCLNELNFILYIIKTTNRELLFSISCLKSRRCKYIDVDILYDMITDGIVERVE